jgi:hypothetical protein
MGMSEVPAPDLSRVGLAVGEDIGVAKQYHDKQRANQKSHQAAVRALAFKWIRSSTAGGKTAVLMKKPVMSPNEDARSVRTQGSETIRVAGNRVETVAGFSKPGPVSA